MITTELSAGSVAISGEPLEPIFPAVAAAQADGAISAAHAGTILDAVDKIPPQ